MMITSGGGISLFIREPGIEIRNYPSCRIQKGPLLVLGNKDLSEEGVGFGVPLIRSGHKVIFPGSGYITIRKDGDRTFLKIDYELNLEERIFTRGRRIKSSAFYWMKGSLSRVHRECSISRGPLTRGSIAARRIFDLETRFEEVASAGLASMEYDIRADGMIHVSADLGRVKKDGCEEIMILNEQGASCFDTFCDSKGTVLSGDAIGSWQETSSDEVSFIDPHDKLAFTLYRVRGSRMFFGRELVGNRLAWSGFAYSINPSISDFAYDIKIGENK